MVSRWSIATIEVLILVACSMLIPVEIAAAYRSVGKWLRLLGQHPLRALWSLWVEFWNSWVAVGTMEGSLYAAALVPDLFGFGTAKACFLVGNLLFFVRLCLEEKLQGQKGNRKHIAQRVAITMILLTFFGFLSFLECGSLTNKENGLPATAKNIWDSSMWWRHPATHGWEGGSPGATPKIPPPSKPEVNKPSESTSAEEPTHRHSKVQSAKAAPQTIASVVIEATLTGDLRPDAEPSPLEVPFVAFPSPNPGNPPKFIGSQGDISLRMLSPARLRTYGNRLSITNNFALPEDSPLLGRPIESLSNLKSVLLEVGPPWVLRGMRTALLVEVVIRINARNFWYGSLQVNQPLSEEFLKTGQTIIFRLDLNDLPQKIHDFMQQ